MQHPRLQRFESASRVLNWTLTFSTATDIAFIPQGPQAHEISPVAQDCCPSGRCLLKRSSDDGSSYAIDVDFSSDDHRFRPGVLVVSSRRPTVEPR